MKKRAFTVCFTIATRVEVEVPKDKEEVHPNRDDELFGVVADEAIEKISANLSRYLHRENVDTIHEEYDGIE